MSWPTNKIQHGKTDLVSK